MPGLINLDFADVRTVMRNAGSSLMGIGLASGENRGFEAATSAISSPLLETSIEGATGILLNVSGGPNMGLFEVNEAAEVIAGAADADANVIFGAVIDESLGDQMRVTVIATDSMASNSPSLSIPRRRDLPCSRPSRNRPSSRRASPPRKSRSPCSLRP